MLFKYAYICEFIPFSMHKARPAIDVRGSQDFNPFFESLPDDNRLKKELNASFGLLREDCTRGDNIPKNLIPGFYVQKYGINNLWRYELNDGARMVYTIRPEDSGLVVYILEAFPTHREYDKRFGY